MVTKLSFFYALILDEMVVDLYSLGPQLLNTLWQFTERINSPSNLKDDDAMNDYNGILDT
jgi:hypothetical protein